MTRPLAPDEALYFLHIPKTAGMALWQSLDPQFAPEEVNRH